MKIVYKGKWEYGGISNLYIKQLWKDSDIASANPKAHHHRCFELHIIENGHQIYECDGKEYRAEEGSLLIIPPCKVHKVIDRVSGTRKHSITFSIDDFSMFEAFSKEIKEPILVKTPETITENINYINKESEKHLRFSESLIGNRITETVVHIMRICGFPEENVDKNPISEDVRFSLAKQYIKDNIEFKPTVEEVAAYCYVSAKQLSRIFASYGITPSLYIKTQIASYAENLLSNSSYTLKEISERLNFSSEYHFNSFFKKYSGITPGEYRKMIKNSL